METSLRPSRQSVVEPTTLRHCGGNSQILPLPVPTVVSACATWHACVPVYCAFEPNPPTSILDKAVLNVVPEHTRIPCPKERRFAQQGVPLP